MTYRARIYQPARNPMQSGKANSRVWKLEYLRPEPGRPDALMGWNSMPDTITEVKLHFATKEEAVAYANAKGIPFDLVEPKTAVVPPKSYAENFSANRRKASSGANN